MENRKNSRKGRWHPLLTRSQSVRTSIDLEYIGGENDEVKLVPIWSSQRWCIKYPQVEVRPRPKIGRAGRRVIDVVSDKVSDRCHHDAQHDALFLFTVHQTFQVPAVTKSHSTLENFFCPLFAI